MKGIVKPPIFAITNINYANKNSFLSYLLTNTFVIMKKFFAVAILALATLSINAQDFKTFRFGPTAGLNVAKATNLDASMAQSALM